MNSIPVIDIGPAISGEDPDSVAAAIYDAIVDVGFFQVIGHGVPAELIDQAYRNYDTLFDQPDPYKDALASAVGNPFRGYFRAERDYNDGSRVESYEITSIASPEEAAGRGIDPKYADYFENWAWPDLDGFRSTIEELFDRTRRVADVLMSLFARAVGLPPEYFRPFLVDDTSNFMCRYYSTQADRDTQRVLLDEHQDSGMLTVLHQRGAYEGLQVLTRGGERITVPVREDAYVINVGKLMTRWTNDLFPATPHRVIDPPTAGESRKSIVLFYLPAVDAAISPIRRCVGPDGLHYGPITTYEAQELTAQKLRDYSTSASTG